MYRVNNKFLFLGALFAALVFAGPLPAADDEGAAKVRQSLNMLLPGLKFGEITPSPIPGLYEVVVGHRLAYVTENGRYLMQGTLIDVEMQKDLTEPRVNAIKAKTITGLDEAMMVIFGPEKAKHNVTVFTDIDCGYCRKLHSEIDQYTERGIRIRYLFYPRAGVGSGSYQKAVSVWCADDRKAAMTLAKSGQPIEQRECENPVQTDMALGGQMGVSGTPALVLDNGKMIPGYVPADRLLAILENESSNN
ncbi:MAG: DsbC family protein [Gammaproteobacteria bacterium]|nr:DsbC family protein [Gammaproteobacteria bacterium]MCB1881285.1 DsbC family protein [Gammaproteobacteria bacterium]MCB1903812.1 DsbC family protein [Gammaproteobacteria bacterium]